MNIGKTTVGFLGFILILAAAPTYAAGTYKIYTTYQDFSAATSITWTTCGSTKYTSGCYGSGSLGTFLRACSIMEDTRTATPATNSVMLSNKIYILDGGAATGDPVMLHVFKKTDIVTSSSDTINVVPLAQIPLPLAGGSNTLCFMAGNAAFFFIGTNATPYAVMVAKEDLKVTEIGGFSPPLNVSGISVDNQGDAMVTWRTGNITGFYVYDENGALLEDGGGSPVLANRHQQSDLTQ